MSDFAQRSTVSAVAVHRALPVYYALRLEALGLHRSRRPSALWIARRDFDVKARTAVAAYEELGQKLVALRFIRQHRPLTTLRPVTVPTL
jgi:hypothetical protein